jgi:hypothetical protein
MSNITRENALGVLLKECENVIAKAPYNTVKKLDRLVHEVHEALKKPVCLCETTTYYEGGYGNRTVRLNRSEHCPVHDR